MSVKNHLIKLFAIAMLVLGGVSVALAPAALADEGESSESTEEASNENAPAVRLQISPVSNRVTLKTGETLEYNVTVANTGKESFKYNVYAAPYSVSGEEYNVSFVTETSRTQMSRWIKFVKPDGTLAEKITMNIGPGEKQTIDYKIIVPEDIPAGGQYATIFAESDPSDAELNGSGIRAVSRVGLIIYGRTDGETTESAEITDFRMPGFMTGGKMKVTSKVKNSGNTDFEAGQTFVVSSILGRNLYEKTLSSSILPESERRLDLEWENTPGMGLFWVKYKVTALGEVRDVTKLVIIMPVFVLIIGILLLTVLIIWIIMIIRKRRERKSRLLVK